MSAIVVVPPSITQIDLQDAMNKSAVKKMFEIAVAPHAECKTNGNC